MKLICKNCMDFDSNKNECEIRYTILKDKSKIPMKRKPHYKGCEVFMFK